MKIPTISARLSKKSSSAERTMAATLFIALFSVYLFWGGTYLGMRVAIETIPPFLMAGARFLLAGAVLYAMARLKGESRPVAKEWKGASIVGALLLLGGNGMVAWAEQRVPSAIASIIIATVPLWMFMCNWLFGDRKRPSHGVMIGILAGLAGIAILVMHTGGDSDQTLDTIGLAVILFASLSWTAGSLYSRKASMPRSPMMSTAAQMLVGGFLLILLSLVLGDWSTFHIQDISFRSYIAFGYLVVFGSIFGYSAYIWLLKNADPTLASTYAFVNPIVAVFLGWLLAGEAFTANSIAATIIIIAAVFMITLFGKKKA